MPSAQRRAHEPHQHQHQNEREPESGERRRSEGPLSKEPQMESDVHLNQMLLLITCIRWWWRERKDFFASGNLSIYYPARSSSTGRKVRRKLFVGPDFFVVLGAEPRENRNSWVVSNEGGKYPNVIVELLSKSTAARDRGKKKKIYEKVFKTPDYFLFDPHAVQLEGYRLLKGHYVPIKPDRHGRLWSAELGMFLGVHDNKLRMFTQEGELVAVPAESALKEYAERLAQQARAEHAEHERAAERAERERAERERERAERERARLAEKLRALGVDPDAVD